jgi:antitoxin MazE
MQVSKWGNSLAVRLPKNLVDDLGLKEGDDIEIVPKGKRTLTVARDNSREEALKKLRALKWDIPADFKFDREEAHGRGWRLDESQVLPPRKRKV